MKTYPIVEHEHTINGVPGRMFTVHEPQLVRGNMVHLNQTWKSFSRKIDGYGTNGQITVEIRFDDNCKNGYQSFAITADIYTVESKRMRDCAACGCLHEEIAAIFPELIPLIKWHLVSTDGPMHYIANTVYHASDKDCHGLRKGEPSHYDTVIRFGNSPISHEISNKFAKFLTERKGTGDFNLVECVHERDPKTFSPNYTFAGYGEKWHECPFKNRTQAEEWQKAINSGDWIIDRIPTAWSEGKERDLDAARNCAVWPDATDEQLTADNLKEQLDERLPALIAEFRADMERIGFLWEGE